MGRVISLNAVQFWKAQFPIVPVSVERMTLFNAVHVLNMIRDKNEWIVRQYENIQQENDIADDGLQEKLEEERKLSCFYRAVKQLPGAKREICLLKIYEGLNNQEIAHRLNIPVGTVKNYYTQSIQLLKYYLKELY